MADERRRLQLYDELSHVLSKDSADQLMDYLPPVGWADVATKTDLTIIRGEMDALRADFRGEMAQLRGEVRGEIAGVRGEIAEVRGEIAEVRGEIAEVRSELGAEIAGVRGEIAGVRSDLGAEIAQTRTELEAQIIVLGAGLRTEMAQGFDRMRTWLVTTVVSFTVAIGGLLLAAIQIHR